MAKKKSAEAPTAATKTAKKIKKSAAKKTNPAVSRKEAVKKPSAGRSTATAQPKKEALKPNLRTVYSNSKLTLLPLGAATDFKTGKPMVIFSDLSTGQVHTIALSIWNRWKLKEVKKINTET